MYGRTNNNGDPYFGELSIPVDLAAGGLYEINFWALIYCNDIQCLEAEDSIKVILGDYQIVIDYNNIRQERVWEKFSYNFRAQSAVSEVKII